MQTFRSLSKPVRAVIGAIVGLLVGLLVVKLLNEAICQPILGTCTRALNSSGRWWIVVGGVALGAYLGSEQLGPPRSPKPPDAT